VVVGGIPFGIEAWVLDGANELQLAQLGQVPANQRS
jgi:hypothetical protein